MAKEIVSDGTAMPKSLADVIRQKADKMGLPPKGQGIRFDYGPSARVFFGRRQDGKLMVTYSKIVNETMELDAEYHPLHKAVVAALDYEAAADSLDELLAD